MPVTAKLSRQFYEKLGDEVVNELVELLNSVDSASRDNLRELNESNWGRVESKFDGFRQEMDSNWARVEAKLDGFRHEMEAFRSEVRGDMAAFRAEIRGEMEAFRAEMRVELHAFRADMIKWMFLFWLGTVVSIGGLIVTLGRGAP